MVSTGIPETILDNIVRNSDFVALQSLHTIPEFRSVINKHVTTLRVLPSKTSVHCLFKQYPPAHQSTITGTVIECYQDQINGVESNGQIKDHKMLNRIAKNNPSLLIVQIIDFDLNGDWIQKDDLMPFLTKAKSFKDLGSGKLALHKLLKVHVEVICLDNPITQRERIPKFAPTVAATAPPVSTTSEQLRPNSVANYFTDSFIKYFSIFNLSTTKPIQASTASKQIIITSHPVLYQGNALNFKTNFRFCDHSIRSESITSAAECPPEFTMDVIFPTFESRDPKHSYVSNSIMENILKSSFEVIVGQLASEHSKFMACAENVVCDEVCEEVKDFINDNVPCFNPALKQQMIKMLWNLQTNFDLVSGAVDDSYQEVVKQLYSAHSLLQLYEDDIDLIPEWVKIYYEALRYFFGLRKDVLHSVRFRVKEMDRHRDSHRQLRWKLLAAEYFTQYCKEVTEDKGGEKADPEKCASKSEMEANNEEAKTKEETKVKEGTEQETRTKEETKAEEESKTEEDAKIKTGEWSKTEQETKTREETKIKEEIKEETKEETKDATKGETETKDGTGETKDETKKDTKEDPTRKSTTTSKNEEKTKGGRDGEHQAEAELGSKTESKSNEQPELDAESRGNSGTQPEAEDGASSDSSPETELESVA